LDTFSEGHFFHKPKWELCSPETASEFSGVGYFFGKKLHHSLDVPIGLIQAAVGGSPCQSWVSKDALASHPQLKHLVEGEQPWINSTIIHPWLAERAKQNWANWEKTDTTPLPGHPFAPNYLFDSAIKPLAPYAIGGAIWYQGESNATHPQSYAAMMKMLLISWRSLWKQGDFPFYFVQLPKIGNRSLWPEFRESQQNCLSNPNTGMIVTLDQGHANDVHPREKEIVGKRLADLALSKTYDQNVLAESPMFYTYDWQKMEHKIVLHFKNTYDGLKINNGNIPEGIYLQGYLRPGTVETIIAPKNIVVAKNEIIITYPTDFLPVKVKYAWAPFPENNLTNSSGLPLAPFKIELEGLN
jgi:sialate O-acetylesterase